MRRSSARTHAPWIAGALVGGATGALGGPAGLVVGAVLGALVGAAAHEILEGEGVATTP